jgi:hypothetical protein
VLKFVGGYIKLKPKTAHSGSIRLRCKEYDPRMNVERNAVSFLSTIMDLLRFTPTICLNPTYLNPLFYSSVLDERSVALKNTWG